MPPFFENTRDRWGHEKINFFPGGTSLNIFPPERPKIHDLLAFWRIRGIIVNKIERQGKGAQHLCIKPNYSKKIVLGT